MSDRTICPLCDSENTMTSSHENVKVYSNVREFKHEAFTVWRCVQCSSLISKENIDFDKYYKNYPMKRHKLDFFCKRQYSKRLKLLKKSGIKKTDKILDYGCGVGLFVQYLQLNGYKNAYGYDAHVKEFSTGSILERKFDYVLLQDVIEHFDDPKSEMSKLRNLLSSKGVLVLGTPDAEKIDLYDPLDQEWEVHQPYHRTILSHTKLKSLLEEAGMKVIHSNHDCYLETMMPGLNTAFLAQYLRLTDGTIDAWFDSLPMKKILLSAKAMYCFFFGFFQRNQKNMLVFARLE